MSDGRSKEEPSLRDKLDPLGRNRAGENRQGERGVLELTEAIGEDGSVRHLSSASGRSEPRPPRPERGEESASPRTESEPTLAKSPAISEGIASATAASAAAAALAGLATLSREKRREGETPLGSAGKTLEEVIRDLLRPLLEAWLNDNLPGLVERLVREEIERVVREAGLR